MIEAGTGTDWRAYLYLVKQSGSAWVNDRAPTMGAALAFYSAFALAPLLIVLIAVAGAIFGPDAARGAIAGQLTGLVGAAAAQAIQDLLRAAQETTTGALATIVGLVTMLVGATTVLVELQDDLDLIWKAPKRAGSSWLSILRARTLSLGLLLAIGFLLLISLVISGAMSAFGVYSQAYLPGAAVLLLPLWNTIFSLAAATVLFAMLYKWLPSVSIAWPDVWIGAFTTAVLFTLGRFAIGVYLGGTAIASTYGAAGTLVILLLWLYYSAQVFLLGAEFTCLYAKRRCSRDEVRDAHRERALVKPVANASRRQNVKR